MYINIFVAGKEVEKQQTIPLPRYLLIEQISVERSWNHSDLMAMSILM